MNVDPAFGLIVTFPLLCIAIGYVLYLRPPRSIAATIAAIGLAGFLIGFLVGSKILP